MIGTLRGVAIQNDIPYDGAEVELSRKTNILADGPLDPRERKLRLAKIHARIRIQGNLSPEDRKILEEAVATCPVGNSLRESIRIEETYECGSG